MQVASYLTSMGRSVVCVRTTGHISFFLKCPNSDDGPCDWDKVIEIVDVDLQIGDKSLEKQLKLKSMTDIRCTFLSPPPAWCLMLSLDPIFDEAFSLKSSFTVSICKARSKSRHNILQMKHFENLRFHL